MFNQFDNEDGVCAICNNETWLAMVLYEPIEADIENATFSSHPTPQDDRPIPVCGQCRNDSASRLAENLGIDYESVPFGILKRYLTYQVYPEYIEQLHPEDMEQFDEL